MLPAKLPDSSDFDYHCGTERRVVHLDMRMALLAPAFRDERGVVGKVHTAAGNVRRLALDLSGHGAEVAAKPSAALSHRISTSPQLMELPPLIVC